MFQKYSENFAFQLFVICSNLPMNFAVFLKSSVFFLKFLLFLLFINKTLRFNILKTRIDMNAKIPVFDFGVEAIIYLLLCNLDDCTVKE